MKILCALLLVLMISSAYGLNDRIHQFMSWTKLHKRNYHSEREFLSRFQIWDEAMNKIEKHNSEEHSYKLAMNHFGDLTHSEFLKHIGSRRFEPVDKSKDIPQPLPAGVPDSWDWRTKGAVTPVQDQGQCGSSPFLAAVGAIEGAHVISGQGSLIPLSVQQVLDCSQVPPYNNQGCYGGLMNTSLEYVRDNKGIDSNASYPYTAQDGTGCEYTTAGKAASIDSYVNVPPNENAVLMAMLINPVATAVMITGDFQYYSSGVFNDSTCTNYEITHGILAVGYGITAQQEKYWILKNTWTAAWGMKGYMLLERGYDRCGVADMVSYPVINTKTKK